MIATIASVILVIIGWVFAIIFLMAYRGLSRDFNKLTADYNTLMDNFNKLYDATMVIINSSKALTNEYDAAAERIKTPIDRESLN